jgi:holo-[acyl-carrier protein] synthase
LSTHEYLELSSQAHPARFLAKRFAAKEAFAKATGQGLRHPVTMHNITVSHDDLGKPIFLFDDEIKKRLDELNISHHHLSISDERDTAVVFVILERKD